MKIVIDIPNDMLERAKETSWDRNDEWDAMQAISHGVQLPEEHGGLVDINNVAKLLIFSGFCDDLKSGVVRTELLKLPIIVAATEAEVEG